MYLLPPSRGTKEFVIPIQKTFLVPRKMEVASISFIKQLMLMQLDKESVARSIAVIVHMRIAFAGTRLARLNL
uniref:Uncharacterized protein n=1 Tax=Rhizophora mucronata TaxID=61149 RepID=A0A2P2Q151_RHIMU